MDLEWQAGQSRGPCQFPLLYPEDISMICLPGMTRLYASHGYNGLYIYDFSDPDQSCQVLASASPLILIKGYNHSSWLNERRGYFGFCR